MRARFFYAFLLSLAFLPFLLPIVRGEIFTVRDHTGYFIPLRHYTTHQLLEGQLPFWNPLNTSGERWLANPQTAVFYPPALLFLVLPFATAYVLFLAVHVGVLATGAYLLFRRWVDEAPAFFGAASLALAGPTMSVLDVSNNLVTLAWFPVLIWSALRRLDGDDRVARSEAMDSGSGSGPAPEPGHSALPIAVPVSLLSMLFLGGEPFLAVAGAVVFSVIVFSRRQVAAFREIVAIGGLAALLSMVQIIPFIEMLIGSDRDGGFSFELAFRESLAPIDWTLLSLSPALFGRGGLVASSQSYIPILYVGTAVVLMAVVALAGALFRRGPNRRVTIAWASLLVVVAILAAGSHLGPGARALEVLGMNVNRYPARLLPMGALAVCALSALGANALRELAPRLRAGSAVVVLVLIAIVMRRHGPLDLAGSLAAALLLAGQCLVLLMILIRGYHQKLLFILTALVSADLLVAARPLLGTAPYPLEVPAIARVMDRSKKIARLPDLEQLTREVRYDSMPGYVNLLEGIHNFSTAAPVSERNSLRFHEEALFTPRPDLLRFLSVGYIIAARPISSPHITPHFASGSIHTYTLRGSWPMVTGWRESGAQLGQLDAALRADSPISIERLHADFEGRVLQLGANDAVVTVATDAPAVIVLNQLDAPGWTVSVDGERADELRVGGLFRAVRVPRGEHIVHWSYVPPYFAAGAVISLLTAFILLGNTIHLALRERGVVGWRERRERH